MNIFLEKLRIAKSCIKKNNDPEAEQALVRVFIGLSLIIYFCIPWGFEENFIVLINSKISIIILTGTHIRCFDFGCNHNLAPN